MGPWFADRLVKPLNSSCEWTNGVFPISIIIKMNCLLSTRTKERMKNKEEVDPIRAARSSTSSCPVTQFPSSCERDPLANMTCSTASIPCLRYVVKYLFAHIILPLHVCQIVCTSLNSSNSCHSTVMIFREKERERGRITWPRWKIMVI